MIRLCGRAAHLGSRSEGGFIVLPREAEAGTRPPETCVFSVPGSCLGVLGAPGHIWRHFCGLQEGMLQVLVGRDPFESPLNVLQGTGQPLPQTKLFFFFFNYDCDVYFLFIFVWVPVIELRTSCLPGRQSLFLPPRSVPPKLRTPLLDALTTATWRFGTHVASLARAEVHGRCLYPLCSSWSPAMKSFC